MILPKLFLMPECVQIKIYKKFLFFIFIFIVFFNSSVLSSVVNFKIIGNKNISQKTILSLAPSNINLLKSDDINTFQKKLFETGFFEKVTISQKNELIVINVIENPLINFFYIEGIKNKTVIDKVYEISQIKENSIFQSFKINEDKKK